MSHSSKGSKEGVEQTPSFLAGLSQVQAATWDLGLASKAGWSRGPEPSICGVCTNAGQFVSELNCTVDSQLAFRELEHWLLWREKTQTNQQTKKPLLVSEVL